MDARCAEEMADSMLWDSPFPEAEEEWKQTEDIPKGESIVPPSLILDILPFAQPFYSKNFLLGPQNQKDPIGIVAGTPHVEASLVVGVNTSITPSGGAPPRVDRIKLARENMGLVQVCMTECQKLLVASYLLIEYLILVDQVVRY